MGLILGLDAFNIFLISLALKVIRLKTSERYKKEVNKWRHKEYKS